MGKSASHNDSTDAKDLLHIPLAGWFRKSQPIADYAPWPLAFHGAQRDKLFITNKEKISISELLQKLLNEANIQPFQLSLQNDCVIEYNLHNISCCMRAFLMEITTISRELKLLVKEVLV